ncbi:hypothetical protein ACIBTV_31165 [Micromonospora sp. NPDC049366]|uniref:hypothetical protein n=1 Tax=Micromonospora sp. NPDC049366 TaxID=3364271 RepID=UPI0037B4A9C3
MSAIVSGLSVEGVEVPDGLGPPVVLPSPVTVSRAAPTPWNVSLFSAEETAVGPRMPWSI